MNRIILSLWCGTYRCLHEKMKPSGLTNKSHDLAKSRLMHFLVAFNRPRRSSYKLWINKKKKIPVVDTDYFSHMLQAAEVRGVTTPERKFASIGSRTHNHQVMSPTRSPLSHPGGEKKRINCSLRTISPSPSFFFPPVSMNFPHPHLFLPDLEFLSSNFFRLVKSKFPRLIIVKCPYTQRPDTTYELSRNIDVRSKEIPVYNKYKFKHIYFTSIEKQVLTTYFNLSRFCFLGTTPVLAPNVWANEKSQS